MIIGVGLDVVDVADFARRLARGSLLKAFSEAERAYAEGNPRRRVEILAARWAAKEAFGKALGTGLRRDWDKHRVEVVHEAEGRPALRLSPDLAGLLPPGARVHLSLTHTPSLAAAVVILEQGPG